MRGSLESKPPDRVHDLFRRTFRFVINDTHSFHWQIDIRLDNTRQLARHSFNVCRTGRTMHSFDVIDFCLHNNPTFF